MNLFQLFNRSKAGDHEIRYIVRGDADDFNVTFKCGERDGVVQEPHIKKGWKIKFGGHNGDYFYISAQANKPHSAIDVMVYEDGKLLNRLSKTGDFPLVQFSGSM